MHGGRELIYVPPSPEETQNNGGKAKSNVIDFESRRRTLTPEVQEDEKKETVIPFQVQARNDEPAEPRPPKPGRGKARQATADDKTDR
jgi:hypothetical protein